jgi:diamine N-acetyltransferase
MEQILVSKASLDDLKAIQVIAKETFFETFAQANTEADMKKYLDENFTDDKIRTELSHPDSLFFIA